MTLALRRAAPDDYDETDDGEIVGRIYRMKADRELWRWTIRLWAPPPGPSGGVSATLDEAMEALRAKWDEQGWSRGHQGDPGGVGGATGSRVRPGQAAERLLSSEIADEKCST